MTLTMEELKQRLAHKDPDELLELLHLDSETLIELAEDIIEDHYFELVEAVSDIDEFSPEEFRV